MRLPAPRRLLAALAGLAAVAVWSAPVQAAPARVDLFVKSYTITPGTSEQIHTLLFADRRLPVATNAVSIRYRFAGQDPSFTLQETGHPDNCSVSQPDLLELTCGPMLDLLTPAGVDSNVVGFIEVADDAQVGEQATLTATLTVKGHAPVTRTARITVGQPIELTAIDHYQRRSAAPGATLDVPLTISNTGTVPAQGTAILSSTQYAMESRTQFSNCTYVDGVLRSCTFDQTLEPGATYRLLLPLRVRRDTYAPSEHYSQWQWNTDEEFADFRQYARRGGVPLGSPGRGGVLRLTEVTTAKAGPRQTLPAFVTHDFQLFVTGKQSTGVAAVGARAAGREGAVVTVPVRLRNVGPAAIDRTGAGDDWPTARVYVPRGTTAVRVPERCYPMTVGGGIDGSRPGAPGEARYWCRFSGLLKVGETTSYEFGLRIDQVVTDARGAVTVVAPAEELNKADNTAAIVINPAGAGAGDGAGSGSGGSGGGGGLPITGPAGATIAALGVLLVLGGGAAVLATRRRSGA